MLHPDQTANEYYVMNPAAPSFLQTVWRFGFQDLAGMIYVLRSLSDVVWIRTWQEFHILGK